MKRFSIKRRKLAPEEEILVNRYVMGGAACITVNTLAHDPVLLAFFCAYLTLNAVLHVMRIRNIWPQEWRCYAAIVLDLSMAFAVMMHAAETMSFFYPLLLWVILGNGFRFGLRFLVFSSILAVLSFGTVVLTTSYWAENRTLGYSLMLALVIIPAYSSTLIKKLSQAKDAAEAASRAKSYFLASVSHELRTPLNAIIGYGNHLKNMGMPKKQHDMVDASVLAGEHLLHLIDQLIHIARSDSNTATIVRQPMRLTDLLTEIRDIMAVRASDKSIALQIAAEPLSDQLVDGPADIVRNILLNLTGNAIKFTESGSVSICGGRETKGHAENIWFVVTDTGIGISPDARDKIFEPFQQADDTVMDRFGGTGLGLAICKQLVNQVGGTIAVESALGQGSSFRVTIPVTVLPQKSASQIDEIAEPPTRIIAIGQFDTQLLEKAQSAGSYWVQKVDCQSANHIAGALTGIDLSQFDIAIIDNALAQQITPEDPIWDRFADAEVAPVLVAGDQTPDLGEISLRAAFASIIPANAGFAELRSAIRIGCSFAHRPRFAPDAESGVAQVAAAGRQCSVLVADDNRTNRNILAAILEAAGHFVSQVCDGDEMLEALEKEKFDIVLLDVNMPRLNGIDACSMWRQIEGGRSHLPIVGVTADATSETEARCLNAGMNLRLTKPINAKLLLETISRLCPAAPAASPAEGVHDPLGRVVAISGHYDRFRMSTLDTDHLDYLQSIGGDCFVTEMAEGFSDDVRECRLTMQAAVDGGDPQQFRFAAHAFKSSANNIGARALAGMCAELEKITEAEFLREGATYMAKIERELRAVSSDLDKLRTDASLRKAS